MMVTPFEPNGALDLESIPRLVDWYLEQGCAGLFAVCQSSEMFFLDLDEKRRLLETVMSAVAGRVKVVASGHTSENFSDQVSDLRVIAECGVDAVVLVPNRLAVVNESGAQVVERAEGLIDKLPEDLSLGWYECPYPYKRLLDEETLDYTVASRRFGFIKDTSCDIRTIASRLERLRGTGVQLYNANTATLLDSLELGASGYSGVMANFQPALYAWLCANWRYCREDSALIQELLTVTSWIELKNYPDSAKHNLVDQGIISSARTRRPGGGTWSATEQDELEQMARLTAYFMNHLSR